jgi:uncharacterized protein
MTLDLREYSAFPVDVALEVELDELEDSIAGATFQELATVKLNLQKMKEEYYCHGEIVAPAEIECSRCLEPYHDELRGELSFVVRHGETKPVLTSDDSDDIIVLKANEHTIDLTDLIRQAISLALPMKPVCSSECRGLCPSCGANLNEEDCDCSTDDIDDRWEGLKDLSR